MKKITLALAFAFVSSTAALACTPEDLQAKATELTNQIQTLVVQDPQKAADVGEKMAAMQAEMQKATDMDGVCKLYDDLLAEIAAAE